MTTPHGVVYSLRGMGFEANSEGPVEALSRLRKLDYFSALGLRPGAGQDDIRDAFRKAAKQWHPNRFALAPAVERAAATDVFILLKEACDGLLDPGKNAAHTLRFQKQHISAVLGRRA